MKLDGRSIGAGDRRIGVFGARKDILTIVALVLVGLGVGLHRLGEKSFSHDEGVSVMKLSAGTISDVFSMFASEEFTLALYTVALWAWKFLAETETQLRGLSVIMYVVALLATYFLGVRIFGRFEALIGSLFLAANGFVVEWAQTARGYSMFMFLTLVSSLVFVRIAEGRRSSGIWYGAAWSLSLFAHPYAWFTLFAQAFSLPFVWKDRRSSMREAYKAIPLVIASSLVAVYAIGKGVDGFEQANWIDPISARKLGGTAVDLLGGDRYWAVPVGIVLLGAATYVAVRMIRTRQMDVWLFALGIWIVVPIVLSIAVSYGIRPILVPRYLIGVIPFLSLTLARSIRMLPNPPVRIVLSFVVLFSLGFTTIAWFQQPSKTDFRQVGTILERQLAPGDLLVVSPESYVWPIAYYIPEVLEPNERGVSVSLANDVQDLEQRLTGSGSTSTVWLATDSRLQDSENMSPLFHDKSKRVFLYEVDG